MKYKSVGSKFTQWLTHLYEICFLGIEAFMPSYKKNWINMIDVCKPLIEFQWFWQKMKNGKGSVYEPILSLFCIIDVILINAFISGFE